MPIYQHTYRSYDGAFRRRFRWVIVVEQELRVLSKAKAFQLLLLLALLHCLLRLLQVVAYDIIMQDPNNPTAIILSQVKAIVVDRRMFFDFVRIQAPLVFLISLYAGAGMICNDFRDNLMEIYFSKPLSWRDYALGKIMTLVIIGLMITAVPACFLVLLHNLLMPGLSTLKATWTLPFSITAFSLAIVLPCALGVLASSSLLRTYSYAAIAVFMVLIANSVMSGLLAASLKERDYAAISLPVAIDRIGQQLFHQPTFFDLRWEWSLLYVMLVCLAALWIIVRKVRRAELAS